MDMEGDRTPPRSRSVAGPFTPSTKPRKIRVSGQTFTVHSMSKDTRESNDIIHTDICIPPAVQVILDTPPVQRLVELKQLGLTYNAYPNCTHTRKSHSMGVSELCGRLATNIQKNQPQLGVSDMDVLCLRMAGLCHDLGHGPYSHAYEVFLETVRKLERDQPQNYKQRNDKFRKVYGEDMPQLEEGYEHEKSSLMMVDFALARIGLEIDWENLDGPLKQIGDGIDATKFGVDRGGIGEKRKVDPFTSRDWVFIKECIFGGPLDEPDAPAKQIDFVGRDGEKEFLYDIVNNRHNGLDVDKIDYYDRDSLLAYGSDQGSLNIFLRDAAVAWGDSPNPTKCFKCKHLATPGKHLMIVYPKKLVPAAMQFFSIRMKNHENVYSHKTTKAAEFLIVDLLVEADKKFDMMLSTQRLELDGFPMPSRFQKFKFERLPLSRAWMHPKLFLRVDDDVIKIFEDRAIDDLLPNDDPLRRCLNARRDRLLYKCIGEEEISTDAAETGDSNIEGDGTLEAELWHMSEDEIKSELLASQDKGYRIGNGECLALNPDDIIVEKRMLHYGRKSQNPVSQMRFLATKEDQLQLSNPIESLPEAVQVRKLPMNTPKSFLRQTIRVFSRDPAKHDLAKHAFESWKYNKEINPACRLEYKTALLTQDSESEGEPDDRVTAGSCKRKGSESLLEEHGVITKAKRGLQL